MNKEIAIRIRNLESELAELKNRFDEALNYVGWIALQVHSQHHDETIAWWNCGYLVCKEIQESLIEYGKKPSESGFVKVNLRS